MLKFGYCYSIGVYYGDDDDYDLSDWYDIDGIATY